MGGALAVLGFSVLERSSASGSLAATCCCAKGSKLGGRGRGEDSGSGGGGGGGVVVGMAWGGTVCLFVVHEGERRRLGRLLVQEQEAGV